MVEYITEETVEHLLPEFIDVSVEEKTDDNDEKIIEITGRTNEEIYRAEMSAIKVDNEITKMQVSALIDSMIDSYIDSQNL